MRRLYQLTTVLAVAAAFFTTPVSSACPRDGKAEANADCPCKHHGMKDAKAMKKKAASETTPAAAPAPAKPAAKAADGQQQSAREQLNRLIAPVSGQNDALTLPKDARLDASAGVFI